MFFTKETLSLLKPLPKRWAGPGVLATDSEPQNLMSVNFSMITDSMTTVLASGEGFARMNEDQVRANVAVVWVLAVIVVLGLTGNALVVSAYRPRPWGTAVSPAAIFILTTAGLDIGTCLFCVPYEIFDLMDPFNNYIALCRTFRFVTTVLGQSRGLMLVCVACDRYFKICLPLTKFTSRHAKMLVLATVILGLTLSWPQIVVNGEVVIETREAGVIGTDCSIMKQIPAIYALLYHVLLYAIFIVCFLTYAVLYGRIFYTLWRNGWFQTTRTRRVQSASEHHCASSTSKEVHCHETSFKRCQTTRGPCSSNPSNEGLEPDEMDQGHNEMKETAPPHHFLSLTGDAAPVTEQSLPKKESNDRRIADLGLPTCSWAVECHCQTAAEPAANNNHQLLTKGLNFNHAVNKNNCSLLSIKKSLPSEDTRHGQSKLQPSLNGQLTIKSQESGSRQVSNLGTSFIRNVSVVEDMETSVSTCLPNGQAASRMLGKCDTEHSLLDTTYSLSSTATKIPARSCEQVVEHDDKFTSSVCSGNECIQLGCWKIADTINQFPDYSLLEESSKKDEPTSVQASMPFEGEAPSGTIETNAGAANCRHNYTPLNLLIPKEKSLLLTPQGHCGRTVATTLDDSEQKCERDQMFDRTNKAGNIDLRSCACHTTALVSMTKQKQISTNHVMSRLIGRKVCTCCLGRGGNRRKQSANSLHDKNIESEHPSSAVKPSKILSTQSEDSTFRNIRRHGGKRLHMSKTTLMVAVVTMITVLGYVPFLTVIVLRLSGVKYVSATASTGDVVYIFCIRSFLLNNVVNPFIYYFVNNRFRQKVHEVLLYICM